MKKHILAVAMAALMSGGVVSSVQAAASVTSVSGGTVNFVGKVVDAACSVAADSQDQTVTLDQVRTDKLITPQQPANQQKDFKIELKDCSTDVSTYASVTFNGQTDPDLATALKNTAGAGSATNVALQMYDSGGNVLEIGKASTAKVTLLSGDTIIPLSVDYIATKGAATPGSVAATATFQINYS